MCYIPFMNKYSDVVAAIDLYHSDSGQFIYNLLEGKYNFDPKDSYNVKKIKWTPLPHIVTHWVITDGERKIELK